MTGSALTLHLTGKEAEYFSKLTSEDDSLTVLLSSHPETIVNGRTVTLPRTASEMLRDYFTERLARVGFDADYKPNTEGRLPERLIDAFSYLIQIAEPELGKLVDRRAFTSFHILSPLI